MKKTAFFTTVYAGCEKFLKDFFTSLHNQNYKDFEIVIINESVDALLLKSFLTPEMTVRIVNSARADAISNRIQGLQYIIETGYDFVVFGDCDDTFSANRVDESLKMLENADIAANELMLVDENLTLLQENYLSQRLNNSQLVNAGFITDKNIFGMSNTALRTEILHNFSEIPDVIAFDWYFFAELLEETGVSARFTTGCHTNYRQYEMNLAGLNKRDESYILRGIQVKLSQYKQLSKKYPKYDKMYKDFDALEKKLAKNLNFKKKYLDRMIHKQIEMSFWWEEIKLMEEI